MRFPYFLVYLVIEIAVFVAMVMTLGFAWAVLITILASFVGFLILRWQGRKVFGELRRASRNEVDARAPLADTAVVGASSILLIAPGLVSTVVGTIALLPPTRRVLRPVLAAVGTRTMMSAMTRAGAYGPAWVKRGTVIDGTVVDDPAYSTPNSSTGWSADQPQLPRGH
ncbi:MULTISPECIES: FxsA family protein [Gordonia]|uniref:FxsA family protein n=1 Tax=Gordonia TaxID=2053 RepID=UPI00257D0132|nr:MULTISPECIES: FxsA family protein [Gordonia]